jgi:hypothetical protein
MFGGFKLVYWLEYINVVNLVGSGLPHAQGEGLLLILVV